MTTNPLPFIVSVLATTPSCWQSLTETLPTELLIRPPATGEWAALDCLRHLLDTEQLVFPVRVRCLLAGEDFANFDPDAQGSQRAPSTSETPSQLAAQFTRRRIANLAELEHITPSDLTRTARHSELGLVTLGELLHEWAAHDIMHTVQAERVLMQPFIIATGSWRPFFQDHEARSK